MSYHILLHGVQSRVRAQLMALSKGKAISQDYYTTFGFFSIKVDVKNIQPIFKDSGAIFSLSTADGYVKIPKLVELVDEGEEVEVYLFN